MERANGRKGKLLFERGPVQFPAESSGGWNDKYVPSLCFLTLLCMPLLQAGVCLESESLCGFVSWNMLYPHGRMSSVVRSIPKTWRDAAICREPPQRCQGQTLICSKLKCSLSRDLVICFAFLYFSVALIRESFLIKWLNYVKTQAFFFFFLISLMKFIQPHYASLTERVADVDS